MAAFGTIASLARPRPKRGTQDDTVQDGEAVARSGGTGAERPTLGRAGNWPAGAGRPEVEPAAGGAGSGDAGIGGAAANVSGATPNLCLCQPAGDADAERRRGASAPRRLGGPGAGLWALHRADAVDTAGARRAPGTAPAVAPPSETRPGAAPVRAVERGAPSPATGRDDNGSRGIRANSRAVDRPVATRATACGAAAGDASGARGCIALDPCGTDISCPVESTGALAANRGAEATAGCGAIRRSGRDGSAGWRRRIATGGTRLRQRVTGRDRDHPGIDRVGSGGRSKSWPIYHQRSPGRPFASRHRAE